MKKEGESAGPVVLRLWCAPGSLGRRLKHIVGPTTQSPRSVGAAWGAPEILVGAAAPGGAGPCFWEPSSRRIALVFQVRWDLKKLHPTSLTKLTSGRTGIKAEPLLLLSDSQEEKCAPTSLIGRLLWWPHSPVSFSGWKTALGKPEAERCCSRYLLVTLGKSACGKCPFVTVSAAHQRGGLFGSWGEASHHCRVCP